MDGASGGGGGGGKQWKYGKGDGSGGGGEVRTNCDIASWKPMQICSVASGGRALKMRRKLVKPR